MENVPSPCDPTFCRNVPVRPDDAANKATVDSLTCPNTGVSLRTFRQAPGIS
jgi:hypothetical protein